MSMRRPAAGIVVVNAPTANTMAAAELTIGLIYALARNIPSGEASLRRGEWRRADFVGIELRGKTLGIVGLGKIGLAIAERARAMEMNLMGSDPYANEAAAAALAHSSSWRWTSCFARADVVTLHVPLNDATRGLIDADALRLMKPNGFRGQRRARRRGRRGRTRRRASRGPTGRSGGRRLRAGAAARLTAA